MIVLISQVNVNGRQIESYFQAEFESASQPGVKVKVFSNCLEDAKKFSLPEAKKEAARLGLEIAEREYQPLQFSKKNQMN